MQLRVRAHFVEVFLVVHRGRHDLAGIRHGAEQRDAGKRHPRRRRQQGLDARDDGRQVGDEQVVRGERIPAGGQHVERRRHVPHVGSVDDSQTTVTEPAQFHVGPGTRVVLAPADAIQSVP